MKHPAGFLTNRQAAAGSLDPRITPDSLTKAGRLRGYALGYSLPQSQGANALLNGSGQLNVVTEVDQYRDVSGAATEMRKGINDLRALDGKRIKGGAKLVRGVVFRVQRIGDPGVGLRLKIAIKAFHIWYTEVVFHHGSLLATVVEGRADPRNVDAHVVALARKLDGRIKGVLSGKIL